MKNHCLRKYEVLDDIAQGTEGHCLEDKEAKLAIKREDY